MLLLFIVLNMLTPSGNPCRQGGDNPPSLIEVLDSKKFKYVNTKLIFYTQKLEDDIIVQAFFNLANVVKN